jgi:hypothetical protein
MIVTDTFDYVVGGPLVSTRQFASGRFHGGAPASKVPTRARCHYRVGSRTKRFTDFRGATNPGQDIIGGQSRASHISVDKTRSLYGAAP